MYDLLVIGSGPGGYVAAIRATQLGLKTVVVEREELGGICLNWGCIPTKALLKSAQIFQSFKKSESYGIEIAIEPVAQLDKVVGRSREISKGMSRGIEYLFKKGGVELVKGSAKIISKGVVEVRGDDGSSTTIESKNIIIATGARANSLPFAPIDGEKIISYRQALVPQTLPASIAVIGSGAIGSELAYFYRAMGSEVTLIEYLPNIVPLEDSEVSATLSRSFRKLGMKVLTSAKVTQIESTNDGCKLLVETKKGEVEIEVERVLSAVGVVPNIENLGLEEVGVELERGRVKVNQNFATSVKGIYAIGDVIATPALAHVASAEAIKCVEAIAGLPVLPIDYGNIPSCIYTTPEIASVGATEAQLKESGVEYKVGKFPFTASGKATTSGEREGFAKLLIDPVTDRLLGAHLIGDGVTEIISGIVTARTLQAKSEDIIESIHPHPTMSEAIMEAAAAAGNKVIHL